MNFGYSDECLAHDTGERHPENPDRLRAIREALSRKHGVSYVDADPIPESAVEAVHDPDYVAEFREFDPDLVLVSAGFDAHRHDPISRMRVSTEGYGMLTGRVREVADAALAFVLEGGYGLDTLSSSVAEVHETFDGKQPLTLEEDVNEDVRELISEVRQTHPTLGE